MTRIIVHSLIATAVILHGACANSPSTAEQAAAAAASCTGGVTLGSVQTLNSSCRVSSSEEHVRLEGVNVSGAGSIKVYFMANASRTNGFELEIKGNGEISATYIGTARRVIRTGQTVNDNSVWCFEVHNDEDPAHILAWKGDGATKCGAPTPATNIAASADMDSEASPAGQTVNLTNGDQAAQTGGASSVFYEVSATNASVKKISTGVPRHAG